MTTWMCVVGLAWVASLVAPDVVQGKAAAEYRTPTEGAKQWPREAVRGAIAMVATDEELGSKAGVGILQRGGDAVGAGGGGGVGVAGGGAAGGENGGGGVFVGGGGGGGGGVLCVRGGEAR